MKFFDSHAHYFDEKFAGLPGGAHGLLTELFSQNVAFVLNAATSTCDSLETLALADRFGGCYAAVGVHPENCVEEPDLPSALVRLKALLSHPKAVAIGEIGLDYHWAENPPREVQKEFFVSQLQLARETGLPAVIHDRDAHGDVFDILAGFPDVTAVLHSYSGSPEMARQYLRNPNRYLSFSGVLTYKNAVQAVETAKLVPCDRMLIETDCPYLAPVPFRGKINHSGYLSYIAASLAEIKGISPEEVARFTGENAMRLFKIADSTKKSFKNP